MLLKLETDSMYHVQCPPQLYSGVCCKHYITIIDMQLVHLSQYRWCTLTSWYWHQCNLTKWTVVQQTTQIKQEYRYLGTAIKTTDAGAFKKRQNAAAVPTSDGRMWWSLSETSITSIHASNFCATRCGMLHRIRLLQNSTELAKWDGACTLQIKQQADCVLTSKQRNTSVIKGWMHKQHSNTMQHFNSNYPVICIHMQKGSEKYSSYSSNCMFSN